MERHKELAKLGILESTDAAGNAEIQRIDSPEDVQIDFELDFLPPYLESDAEAQRIFKKHNFTNH